MSDVYNANVSLGPHLSFFLKMLLALQLIVKLALSAYITVSTDGKLDVITININNPDKLASCCRWPWSAEPCSLWAREYSTADTSSRGRRRVSPLERLCTLLTLKQGNLIGLWDSAHDSCSVQGCQDLGDASWV